MISIAIEAAMLEDSMTSCENALYAAQVQHHSMEPAHLKHCHNPQIGSHTFALWHSPVLWLWIM